MLDKHKKILYYIRELRIVLNFYFGGLMTYITGKRERIIDLLSRNRDRAFSLPEICDGVTTDGKGKSTVYRLVSALAREGIVRRIIDDETREITYQLVGGGECAEHLHLKCRTCGRLFHLDQDTSHTLGDRLLFGFGFELDEGTLLLGRCRQCRGGGNA